MKWVLQWGTKPMWFRGFNALGPACTTNVGEAVRFKTRRQAESSPAHSALAMFHPRKLPLGGSQR